MADEVFGAGLKTKVVKDLDHWVRVEVEGLVGGGILVAPVLDELEELLCSTLLKEAHERRADGFHLGGRHLGNLAISVNVRGSDLLELEVPSDIGVNEHLRELTVGHDKFGDEINCPVAVTAPVLGRFSAGTELLVELREVERGHLTTINLATVDVQDLLAIDGQECGKHALGHTGAENDGVCD